MATTTIADLINPEVLAPMINAKIEKKLIISKIAKIDTTLQGQPGNEVTVPQYAYIGDAEDIAEGVACGTAKLQTSSVKFTIKKAMKGTEITDEAMLSGYGDPVGESENQLSKAIANKVDNDVVDVLSDPSTVEGDGKVQLISGDGTAQISYNGLVDGLDLFEEEVESEKVMYVHPKQRTTLRKDANFISNDKYNNDVMLNGEIGMIAGTRIVASKKVKLIKYMKDNSSGTITIVTDGTVESSTSKHLSTVQPHTVEKLVVGDKVKAVTNEYYLNPVVKLNNDAETEEDAPAVTIFLKRDTQVEKKRIAEAGKTEIFTNKHYGVALTNTAKVVLIKFKK